MPNAYGVGLLVAGGLALLLTGMAAAVLHGAIGFAVRTGRADRKRLGHVALMRAWLGLVVASGAAFCLLLAWGAAEAHRTPPAIPRAFPSSPPLRAAFWLYTPWLLLTALAFPVAGRWCRRVFRSLRVVKATRAYPRARLCQLRFCRLPPVSAVRGFLRRHDRRLW